jgi:glycosyltransferase involved in cell wall biosynthesis
MPRVMIGVPVLNGARHLERCLRSLLDQDYRDFGILVSDNASSDATPAIAREFAAADPRIRIIRQPRTLPMMVHFRAVMEAADCPFFAWRAHDDWSDPDWLTRLMELLDRHPSAMLAVSRMVVNRDDGAIDSEVNFPESIGATPDDRIALLRLLAPQWIYGVWRREPLHRIYAAVQARYPHIWSQDNALIMCAALAGGVVGTNATCFHIQWSMNSKNTYFPTHWRMAWRHYADFWAVARDAARENRLPLSTLVKFYAMMPSHARGRTEKLRRIGRGWLNERLGGPGLTRPKDRRKTPA